MFESCKHIDRICIHASKSKYNPLTGKLDGSEKTLCGLMSGYNCEADNLEVCWLDMSVSKRSTHKKKMKIKYDSYKLARR